jgi:opacity protein-like surface antigen
MKKITGVFALTVILTTAAQASLNLGLSVLFDNNDLDSGVGVAIPQVGWQFTDNNYFNHTLETELMFLSQDGTLNSVHYDGKSVPLMLNYRLDWNPNDLLGIYGGLGLGISFNSMDAFEDQTFEADGVTLKDEATASDIGDTSFAYQLQLGASLTFAEHFRVNLGYRYLNTGDQEGSSTRPTKLAVDGARNIIDLGLRYKW